MKKFCFTTPSGTATPETCLCEDHKKVDAHRDYVKWVLCPDDVEDFDFIECTGNREMSCVICGLK